jgi:hypothetical protein
MDDWVTVALEEYKTLRAESLGAIEQMQRTLQIGVAAIGLITGFGIDTSASQPAVQAGFAVATPALAGTVLVLWLDQLRRSVFAGAHVARIEHRIAERFANESPPLTWETSIQTEFDPGSGYRYHHHWATAGALFAAAVPMIATSIVRLGRQGDWALFTVTAVAVGLILLAALSYQAWVHRQVSDKHRETRVAIGLEASPESGSA